jgi:hypothetical protein
MTDLQPIAKCPLFEYIETAPIPAEKKSKHSNPNDTLVSGRAHIMIFDSPEAAVYQTKMPRAHPTLSTKHSIDEALESKKGRAHH